MKKLLIADDEDGIRSLVRMTLESTQYEILEAENGIDALSLVQEHHPQLVLLDVSMPGLDGFDVCRAIKTDDDLRDTYIIMLTAKAQEQDIEEGRGAGADDYFTKPFSPVTLMRKVDEIFSEGSDR